jgi:hypothetical protein
LTNTCVLGCGRPTETQLCTVDLKNLLDDLREIEALLPDLDVAVTRQAKIGGSSVGFVSGTSEQRIPVHLGASAVVAELRDKLAVWVHTLWEENAPRWHRCGACGAEDRGRAGDGNCAPGCPTRWDIHVDPLDVAVHPLPLSKWLLRHPSWMAGHSEAAGLHDDVTAAVRHAKRVIYGPAERIYLGICSAPVEVPVGDDGDTVLAECQRDLYGAKDRRAVVCPDCGWEFDADTRRRVMLGAMEDQLLTATELSRALPSYLEQPLTASMVRGYALRGRLLAHGTVDADPDDGAVEGVLVVAGRRRAPRYRVGDVLDVLTEVSAREAS